MVDRKCIDTSDLTVKAAACPSPPHGGRALREGAPQFRRTSVGLGGGTENHQETPEKMEVVNACPEEVRGAGGPTLCCPAGACSKFEGKTLSEGQGRLRDARFSPWACVGLRPGLPVTFLSASRPCCPHPAPSPSSLSLSALPPQTLKQPQLEQEARPRGPAALEACLGGSGRQLASQTCDATT